MLITTSDKLKNREPVQWGIDYIDESLSFITDIEVDQEYKMKIIFSSGNNLAESYRNLIRESTEQFKGVQVADNWEAAKLMILRLLVKSTPCPGQYQFNSANKLIFHYIYNLNYLRKFFSQINLSAGNSFLPKSFILETLKLSENRGLNLNCLNMNSYPLLICSLPYIEKTPACYFYSFHTALLFSNSYHEYIKKHLILHEIGHVLFNLKDAHKSSRRALLYLLALIEKNYPYTKVVVVKPFRRRFSEEVFSDLLAAYLLLEEKPQKNIESKPVPNEIQKALKLYLSSLIGK
ncbi:MAG: hypothetical protein CVU88_06790 [Firmicutes bacterium HGW-Firmicutes-13]|nr:MAG: hypothetical protein CVU88_06790 [Firmicutes bacterium HGW-Firmicutes-13]